MISFVTVTYNSARTIRACLEASTKQANSEVVVVDNDSHDNTLEICREFSTIKLIPTGKNLGFNGGNDVGVKHSKGEIIVFLNPDAVLPAGFSERLTNLFAKLPDVGMIGFRMTNEDGSLQPTGSMLPTMGSLLYEHSAYHRFFPKSRAYRRYVMKDWDRSDSRQLGAVAGSCLAIRRADLEAAGGLDVGYFLFYEEVDLGKRLLRLGKPAYYAADIEVRHIGAVSTKQENNDKINRIYHDSRDYYIRKFHGPAFLVTFKTLAWLFNKAYGLTSLVRRVLKSPAK